MSCPREENKQFEINKLLEHVNRYSSSYSDWINYYSSVSLSSANLAIDTNSVINNTIANYLSTTTLNTPQYITLGADRTNAIGTTIATFFDPSVVVNLESNSKYEVEYMVYVAKATDSTTTWSLSASNTFTNVIGHMHYAVGIEASSPLNGSGLVGQTVSVLTFPVTPSFSGSKSSYVRFHSIIETGSANQIVLACLCASGTMSPLRGSLIKYTKIS